MKLGYRFRILGEGRRVLRTGNTEDPWEAYSNMRARGGYDWLPRLITGLAKLEMEHHPNGDPWKVIFEVDFPGEGERAKSISLAFRPCAKRGPHVSKMVLFQANPIAPEVVRNHIYQAYSR